MHSYTPPAVVELNKLYLSASLSNDITLSSALSVIIQSLSHYQPIPTHVISKLPNNVLFSVLEAIVSSYNLVVSRERDNKAVEEENDIITEARAHILLVCKSPQTAASLKEAVHYYKLYDNQLIADVVTNLVGDDLLDQSITDNQIHFITTNAGREYLKLHSNLINTTPTQPPNNIVDLSSVREDTRKAINNNTNTNSNTNYDNPTNDTDDSNDSDDDVNRELEVYKYAILDVLYNEGEAMSGKNISRRLLQNLNSYTINPKDITEYIGYKSKTVFSNMVSNAKYYLSTRGYILNRKIPDSKRFVSYSITDAGIELLNAYKQELDVS